MINVRYDAPPLTFPENLADEIVQRIGPPPEETGTNDNPKVDYATRVITEYVLTEERPDVLLNWMTEPDGSQHEDAAGSPEAIATIRNDDRNIGIILDRLEELGVANETNIFVVSDHGFSLHTFGVNVEQELIDAGLKKGPNSNDVVVADTDSALIYVRNRNPGRIMKIVKFLQSQNWSDAIYTAARRPEDGLYRPVSDQEPDVSEIGQGWVEGTFSLELIHEANPERAADILLTLPWSSEPNAFGVPGTSYTATAGTPTGPISGSTSGHGSFSPWDITNTLFVSGVSFKDGVTSPVPSGNVDVAPTILDLEGVGGSATVDGRVLREALNEGPEEIPFQTRVLTTRTRDGGYAATIRVSEAEATRYIDMSRRLP